MADNQPIVYSFEAQVDEAVANLNKLSSTLSSLTVKSTGVNKLSKAFSSLGSVSKSIRRAVGAVAGISIGKAITQNMQSTIKYVETLNMYQQALGDAKDAGTEFIESISDMYGLDPAYLTEWTALFYEMGHAVGMPTEAAQVLSQNLTVLSTDIGSLFDYDFETVANNLASGMRGMSRAVLKYGMDVRAATVEAYAHSEGITRQYSAMSEAEREILRYIVMVKQATDAQGDFAITIESPANQLRILREQLAQVGRNIGNFLVAPLAKVLPYLNAVAMLLKTITGYLAAFFGVTEWIGSSVGNATDSLAEESDAIAGVGDAADKSAKKVKALLAPFDELNVLQESAGSKAGAGGGVGYGEIDPAILALLDKTQYKIEQVKMRAQELYEAMLKWLGLSVDKDGKLLWSIDTLRNNLKDLTGHKWDVIIDAVFDTDWKDVYTQIKNILSVLVEISKLTLANVFNDLMGILGIDVSQSSIAQFITDLPTTLGNIAAFLDENKEAIASWAAKVVELGIAFSVLQAVAGPVSTALGVVGAAFSFIGGLLPGMVTGIATISSKLALLIGKLMSLTPIGTKLASMFGSTLPASLGATLAGFALLAAGAIDGLVDLWNQSSQFRDNVGTLLKNIVDTIKITVRTAGSLIKTIWTYFVQPVIETIGDAIQGIYPTVVAIVNAIVGVIQGVVTILDGILNGDIKEVFKGFVLIIVGLAEAVGGVVTGIINVVVGAVVAVINTVGQIAYTFVCGAIAVANALGASFTKPDKSTFVIDEVPSMVLPTFDYESLMPFAQGGVVTGPTHALIGEAGRSEAVIPLDNSPQMEDLIQRIADAVETKPTEVRVFIGDKEWDAFTYQSAERGKSLVGAQPIKIGG